MKLFLPKLLLMAVMAAYAYSQDANQATNIITGSGCYEENTLLLEGNVVMPGEDESDEYDDFAVCWHGQPGEASITGTGRIYSIGSYWFFDIGGSAELYTIGKGVTLENVEVVLQSDASPRLVINGALNNYEIEAHGTAKVDISQASISGMQEYDLCSGSTLIVNQLEVRENVFVETYNGDTYIGDGVSTGDCVTLQGNLVFNGTLPAFTGEQRFDYSYDGMSDYLQSYGAVQFWVSHDEGEKLEPFVPICVTGTITIKSETAIVFANEGDYENGNNGITTWLSDYRLPTSTDVLFICSSVNEESLSLLKPYAYREDSWADYSGESEVLGGYEYIKPVDDREFYAKAGADGKVYIYLGEASGDSGEVVPPVPSEPEGGSVVLNDLTLADANHYGSFTITGKNLELRGNWTPPYSQADGELISIDWISEDASASYALTGSGTLGDTGSIVELDICGPGQFTIAKDITITNSEISLDESDNGGAGTILSVEGTLHNANVYVGRGSLKLDKATLSGYQFYELEPGSVVHRGELNLSAQRSGLSVYDYDRNNAYANPKIVGNLVLDGQGSYFGNTEKTWTGESEDLIVGSHAFNPVVAFEKDSATDGKYTTLEITGSLTVKSETAVLFGVWDNTYSVPDKEDCLIICSSVNEGGLKKLAPYAQRADYDYSTGEYVGYTIPLADHAFFAQSGADGRVYIYLGTGGEAGVTPPAEPDVPVLVVKPGDKIVLGGSNIPSLQTPAQLQGGVADASGLASSLLNNQLIQGSGGTLQTASNQTMHLTGGGKVQYSITGTEGNTHGADIEIETDSNLSLNGTSYAARTVVVKAGTVTISGNTTLGTGTAGDRLDLSREDTHATNFGRIEADVLLGKQSTLLNENELQGDVSVGGAATMVNNGVIAGQVLVEKNGKVYGSGRFADTVMLAGAYLHVGNSPGYQKHTSLTMDRGAVLSFSVDGPMAATADDSGSGRYSVLLADTLTINPGAGRVTVNVDVTMGVVAAGSEPLSLTLLDAGTSNATEDDFTFNISDESNLLEEGATLRWDSDTKSLTLTAAVNRAALAAIMDSNSANVANTMWASANAVQEMARTAENQFIIGMPGQTTFWGAGIGSFMAVSGSSGFSSNTGGYAVGLQHAFTENFRAGFAFGQTFGSFESDDKQLKADQMALMPTLTAQYVAALDKVSSLSVSGHLSYGVVKNEAETWQLGSAGNAEWDDKVLNLGVRVAWNRQLTEHTTATVYTGFNYQMVEQDDFTETIEGVSREYRDGSMSSLSLPLGVTLRGIYQMEGTNLFVPEVTLAYIGDVARDNPEMKTSVNGLNREGQGTSIGRSAVMVSGGANWMFDSCWSVGAFYTLEARSKQVNQSVNAALRCCF